MPSELATQVVTDEFGEEVPANLPESDGEPMDTLFHATNMTLLIEVTYVSRGDRTDYFVGGNMFLYYSAAQARNRDYKGPDYFYVDGVDLHRNRQYWAVWDEGFRYPNVIVELTSPTTEREDRTTKFRIYEQTFATPEYFLYDPEDYRLEGWRLAAGRYQPILPDARGWLWSESLQRWLGRWEGMYRNVSSTFLRLYDTQGQMVPTEGERAKAEAEAERQNAEAERQNAEAQRQRADAAEAEIESIRRELAAIQAQTPKADTP